MGSDPRFNIQNSVIEQNTNFDANANGPSSSTATKNIILSSFLSPNLGYNIVHLDNSAHQIDISKHQTCPLSTIDVENVDVHIHPLAEWGIDENSSL